MPLAVDPKYGYGDQYTNFKADIFQEILSKYCELPYVSEMPAVNVSVGEDNHHLALVLANFSLDDYKEIKLHLPNEFEANIEFEVSFRDGSDVVHQTLTAKKVGNDYILPVNISGLSLMYLVKK